MSVQCLNDGDLRILRDYIPLIDQRDAAIIGLLIYCGLRIGELCSLNVSSVSYLDKINSDLYIPAGCTKSGRARTVPIPPPCRELLGDYIATHINRMSADFADRPLFLSYIRKGRLSARDVQRIVSRHSRTCLGRHINPHMLRHTYATQLMRVCNVRVVQLLLGHASLGSTMIYTHPNSADMAAAVASAYGGKP